MPKITYNGNVIADTEGTVTMKTADKQMVSDVTVEDNAQPVESGLKLPKVVISFEENSAVNTNWHVNGSCILSWNGEFLAAANNMIPLEPGQFYIPPCAATLESPPSIEFWIASTSDGVDTLDIQVNENTVPFDIKSGYQYVATFDELPVDAVFNVVVAAKNG